MMVTKQQSAEINDEIGQLDDNLNYGIISRRNLPKLCHSLNLNAMWWIKTFILSFFILALPMVSWGQSEGDYRARQNGTWASSTTWQVFTSGNWENLEDGAAGGFQDVIPTTSGNGSGYIEVGFDVSFDGDVTINRTTVTSSGSLTIDIGVTVTLEDDFTDIPLSVQSGGEVVVNGTLNMIDLLFVTSAQIDGTMTNAGTVTVGDPSLLIFNSGGLYIHNFTTGGDVPDATWDANSTVRISNLSAASPAAPANIGQSFGHFEWNTPSMGSTSTFHLAGELVDIQGNLTVVTTNARILRLSSSLAGFTLNIGGDLVVQNGTFFLTQSLSTATTINIGGNISQSGGTISLGTTNSNTIDVYLDGNFSKTAGSFIRGSGTGVGTLRFSGTSQTFSNVGTVTSMNFSVESGSSVTMSTSLANNTGSFSVNDGGTLVLGTSVLSGTSTAFNLNSGGTLRVGATDASGAIQTGTTNGNIRVGGTRTYSNGSTIEYNGSSAQFIGNGHPTTGGVNTIINNSSGVTIVASTTLGGDLTLTSGDLNLGTGSFTLTVGDNSVSGSGDIVHTSGNIIPNGSGTSSIVLNGNAVTGTANFGASAIFNNFTVNRSSGSVTLAGTLRVNGTLSQTAGNIILNGNRLRIAGDYIKTSGDFVTSTTSSLEVIGSGATLNGFTVQAPGNIKTFVLNNAVGISTGSSLIITDTLFMANGAFGGGGALTMANSSTIYRSLGSTSKTISASGVYNVTYNGSVPISTGVELPSGATVLNNLFIESSDAITLTKAITINGNFNLDNGSFDSDIYQVTLEGNFVSAAAGDFSGSNFVFAGNTTISGGVAPTFSTVTINPSSTLNLGSSEITVTGNITNNGTMTAGTSTVNFTGTTTIDGTGVDQSKSTGTVSIKGSFHHVNIDGALTIDCSTCGDVQNSFGINISGDLTYNSGSLTPNESLIDFNGSSTQTITASAVTFNSVDLSGSKTVNLGAALNINNRFFISETTTFSTSVSNFGLNLGGDMFINGTLEANQSVITFNGNNGNQSIDRTAGTSDISFYDITVNKSSGSVFVETNASLQRNLTISSSTTFDGDGAGGSNIFTLLSTATRTARVEALASGASVAGNVTVQRFLSNGDDIRVYRYLGTPTTNSFVSDWQNEIPITGTFSNPSTGTGINSANPSMYYYNEPTSAYVAYPSSGSSTAAALVNGRGYSIFVRSTADFTLDTRGTLAQGNININLTDATPGDDALGGWNLIANPYPSAIDWKSIDDDLPAGVLNAIYVKDNTDLGNLGAGQYITYIDGVGVPGSYTGVIGQGQAFWVNVTANATLTFNEADKISTTATVYREQAPLNAGLLRIHVQGNNRQDEAVVRFKDGATSGLDVNMDAQKLGNDYLNLSTKVSGTYYTVNTLPILGCNEELALIVNNFTNGTYSLSFSELESFDYPVSISLYDVFLDSSISISPTTNYQFVVGTDALSKGENRFKVRFERPEIQSSLNISANPIVCENAFGSLSIENSQAGVGYFVRKGSIVISDTLYGIDAQLIIPFQSDSLSLGQNELEIVATYPSCNALPLAQKPVVEKVELLNINPIVDIQTCAGLPITFDVSASNAVTYKWYKNEQDVDPLLINTSGKLSIQNVSKSITYYVSAVNLNGCEGSRLPVNAFIANAPVISEVQAATVCEGQSTQLSVPEAEGAVSYRWYNSASSTAPILDTTSNLFTTKSLTSSTEFYVTGVNANGCEGERRSIHVIVDRLPVVAPLETLQVCKGGSVSIDVSNYTDAVSYRWYSSSSSNQILSTSKEIKLNNITTSKSIYVSGLNASGCEGERREINIEVPILSQPSIENTQICVGSNVILQAYGASSEERYVWYLEGSSQPIATNLTGELILENIASNTNVFVALKNVLGCEGTKTPVTVSVVEIPTLTDFENLQVCKRGSFSVSAQSTSSAVSYKWVDDLGNVIQEGTSASLSVNNLLESHVYSVVALNALGCESASKSFNVQINTVEELPTVQNVVVCQGESVTLQATGGTDGLNYVLYSLDSEEPILMNSTGEFPLQNVQLNTQYLVSFKNNEGCESEKVLVDVNVLNPPVLSDLQDLEICENEGFSLQVSSTGNATNYKWIDDLGNIVQEGASGILEVASLSNNKTYYVTAYSEDGCESEQVSAHVNVVQFENPIANSQSACGASVIILSASGASENNNYNWYATEDATEAIQTSTTPNFTTPELTSSTTYFVSITNSLGCEGDRIPVEVEVVNLDPVIITTEDDNVLISSYSEGNQWYLDGVILEGETQNTIVPTASGIYSVVVTILGCEVTAEIDWRVLGINKNNVAFDLYPNPTDGFITIEGDLTSVETITVYSLQGVLLKMFNKEELENRTINISGFTNGTYLVILQGNEIKSVSKIVKN